MRPNTDRKASFMELATDLDMHAVASHAASARSWPKALATAGVLLVGLVYLQVVMKSKEKWFHFLLMAVCSFGAI